MPPVPAFDEVHVVSDLHLGGAPGFQIFDLTNELEGLISFLCQRPPGTEVALVINGDFVDFLAEEPARCFDPHDAISKLDRIVGDAAFAPVWSALQRFAATPDPGGEHRESRPRARAALGARPLDREALQRRQVHPDAIGRARRAR